MLHITVQNFTIIFWTIRIYWNKLDHQKNLYYYCSVCVCRDPTGIQMQNVFVHFVFSNKMYMYTLFSKAECTKCADWIKSYNLENKQVFIFLIKRDRAKEYFFIIFNNHINRSFNRIQQKSICWLKKKQRVILVSNVYTVHFAFANNV